MNRSTKRSIILGLLSTSTAVLLTAAPAAAQDATVGVGATTTIPSGRARTTDPGEGRAAASAAPGGSAHEAAVGRLGVGWLGTADVPVGPANQAGNAPIPTPVVGIRYWLNSMLGIDAGLGRIQNPVRRTMCSEIIARGDVFAKDVPGLGHARGRKDEGREPRRSAARAHFPRRRRQENTGATL